MLSHLQIAVTRGLMHYRIKPVRTLERCKGGETGLKLLLSNFMILPACVGFLIHHKQANQLDWGFLRVFMYLQSPYEHAVLRQTKIITDPCRMLHTEHQLLPSERKFRVPRCQFNNS